VAQDLDHPRQDRDEDDRHDQVVQVALHHRQVAEEIAGVAEQGDPGDGADHVVGGEAAVGHVAHAGDEGGEGAHDGHEAGEDDGLAAVSGVEGLGDLQMAAAEDLRVRVGEQPDAEEAADAVVDGVAENGGDDQQNHHQVDVHRVLGGDGASDEQQRVARQERRHHQAGLAEDDQEQDAVDPGPVGRGQLRQVAVDVQDEVDDELDEFHRRLRVHRRASCAADSKNP